MRIAGPQGRDAEFGEPRFGLAADRDEAPRPQLAVVRRAQAGGHDPLQVCRGRRRVAQGAIGDAGQHRLDRRVTAELHDGVHQAATIDIAAIGGSTPAGTGL
jgi:hypothetical protein